MSQASPLPASAPRPPIKGFLGWIERTGNALPDPVFIFFILMAILVAVSQLCQSLGIAVPHPTKLLEDGTPEIIAAQSLLSPDNIQKFWVQMPTTFAHFHPLGYVLVVMLGAGVAERTGLFSAAMRASVKDAPRWLLTPAVAFVAMMGNLAADAAYVVLIPLSGLLFAAVGRHPVAGIACAFAGVSGGFSANLLPGQLDALLFGITQGPAQNLDPTWVMNLAGNWYFMAGFLLVLLPMIWFITDKIIEPRLGPWTGGTQPSGGSVINDPGNTGALNDAEKKGLGAAGLALLAVVGLWVFFVFGPGTPLINEDAPSPPAQLTPLYQSLVGGFFLLFLATGWAYGAAAGTIKSHKDVVRMMSEAMADMGYYLVLSFAAAHFVAMFNWSNLGLIFAVQGANGIESLELDPTIRLPVIITLIILITAFVNLFVGSASAKWALLAPVLVPMMMLSGISPEMATAAYRVGDGATNIITPLMSYFPLILIFAQRWDKNFGLGSLAATMIPFSVGILIAGIIVAVGWVALDLPLGPNASVTYSLPVAGAGS